MTAQGRVDLPVPTALTSERLVLKPWRLEDAPAMYELLQDPLIREYSGLSDMFTLEQVQWYIGVNLAEGRANGSAVAFSIRIGPAGQIVGSAGLLNIRPRRGLFSSAAACTLWLGAPYRGLGIATEALRTVARWGFEGLRLDRIEAYHYPDNHAVGAVNARVGFSTPVVLRSAGVRDGRLTGIAFSELIPADLDGPVREAGGA